MIPPVKPEPASVVAIAPTPSDRSGLAAGQWARRESARNLPKAALQVTQQPPHTWYKDQFGRKATFELRVRRSESVCPQCVEQRILAVQLLYESGKPVEKQEILHVMAGQCLDRNRESVLAVRIAEVSKNHLNQRFRVQVAVPKCPGACDYETAVVTDPVLVLSKKKKRPVKQDADAASPATAKKAKRASMHTSPTRKMSSESPDSSQSSSTVTGSLTAALAEMEDTTPSRTTESMAPFTPDSPNLCLWANAAFDLLHKLQWQRVLTSATDKSGGNLGEILSQALSKAYKCPSCQETYGQVPTHKDDCDLKLLLEQGGIPEASATGKVYDLTTNHSNQWPADTELEWPDRPKVMYSGGDTTPKVQTPPYNLSRNLLQLSADRTGRTQAPTNAFNSNVAASTLNVNSWKDYASISKLLYSTSYLDGRSPVASAADNSTLQWTGALPPVGTLTSGVSTFPSAAKSSGIMQARAPRESQQFSALLAATKGMSADAADLFREAEAALNGDGNIVNSLSNLSVSDLMRPNIGDNDDNEIRFAHKAISLSGLLSADQPVLGISVEREVAVIMASDFRDCGFPALDASFNSLGFYHLLTATHDSAAELCFSPHLFALPEEMLEELKQTIVEWRQNPSIFFRRDEKADNSLIHLKNAVLQHVT